MGYRSDWKLVFNTFHKAKHVKSMLEDYVVNNPDTEESKLLGKMLSTAILFEDDCILELGKKW